MTVLELSQALLGIGKEVAMFRMQACDGSCLGPVRLRWKLWTLQSWEHRGR